MREISPKLTPALQAHFRSGKVWQGLPFPVPTFGKLVEQVAQLAYLNGDELLFFRGQGRDYQSRSAGSTLYPPIYRGDPLLVREVRHRFDLLDQAASLLVEKFRAAGVDGHQALRQKKYIQWSILQHYEVTPTPLLDITHSLRVACSFAMLDPSDAEPVIFVLGLPFLANRIAVNSEHDIVNIRLLSICPPAALRPYYQEGYLAGTTDVTWDYDEKTTLDFRNRLIAKFQIPNNKTFWGKNFNPIPKNALYPRGDAVLDICSELKLELRSELRPGNIGEFLQEWARLEDYLVDQVEGSTGRRLSVRDAAFRLGESGALPSGTLAEIDAIRRYRNSVVHTPKLVDPPSVFTWLDRLRTVLSSLPKDR